MLNFNEEELKKAIVEKAADEILRTEDDLSTMIGREVKRRLDVIFSERAEAQITAAIDAAVIDAFNVEYQRANNFGEPVGPKTTIRKELDAIVSGYWSAKVNPKTGSATDSTYGDKVSRAEYVMTTICAKDFSERLKQDALSVTGALKDGMRNQLAKVMDETLDALFRVKSLQDQGKVEKPY
jgi:hypothetical protein